MSSMLADVVSGRGLAAILTGAAFAFAFAAVLGAVRCVKADGNYGKNILG